MATVTPAATIVVIGSLNVDLVMYTSRIPDAGETITGDSFGTQWGGKGANQAVAAARIASNSADVPVHVRMVGAVGTDEFGPAIKVALADHGVDTTDVRSLESEKTGTAIILVEPSGENRILLHPGANGSVISDLLPPWLLKPIGDLRKPSLIVMQLEIPLDTVLQICKTAIRYGIPVLLNPAPAIKLPPSIYSLLSFLIVNETEASMLSGIHLPTASSEGTEIISNAYDAARWFIRSGCQNVVVTLGSLGAVYLCAQSDGGQVRGYTPAYPTTVVDTTAAGDTFIGALSVILARYWSIGGQESEIVSVLERAVNFAARASSWTVAHKGTWEAMPKSTDLQ